MNNYRIVVTHSDSDHSDTIMIQKKGIFFWKDHKEIYNGQSFCETLDDAHTELLNYIQYGE